MDLKLRAWLSLSLFAVLVTLSSTATAQQADEGAPPPPPPPAESDQAQPDQAAQPEQSAQPDQSAQQEKPDEAAPTPPPPPSVEEVEKGESNAQSSADEQDEAPPAPDEADQDQGSRAGWELLSQAFEQLARGHKKQALSLLEQLQAEYPAHPATEASASARAILREKAAQPHGDELVGEEDKTGLARAELAFFQTAHGITLGAEMCILLECDSSQAVVASLTAGGALGLTLSLATTTDGITPGHALALNSGTAWGLFNGAMLDNILQPDGNGTAGLLAASQLAGLGAGALIWDQARPTAGEVSMANSGGFWLGFLTFLGHAANDFDADTETISWSVLLAADLGIAGGAILSRSYPMSRGRTFVIDSGGILGFLLGVGTYVFIEPDINSATGFSVMGMLGTVTGLGASTYLTRNWDDSKTGAFSANWSVLPTEGGAMLSLDGAF